MSSSDFSFIFDSIYFNSKFEFDPRIMLQEFEFSNIMSIHYWRMKRVMERTEKLLKQTEKTLELLKSELKKNNTENTQLSKEKNG